MVNLGVVSRLGLHEDFVQFVENDWGIKTLHLPQAEAMLQFCRPKHYALHSYRGKSLVAFMGLVNQIMTRNVGSRGIYIVPLFLASEKLEELKQLESPFEIGLGIGDAPNGS